MTDSGQIHEHETVRAFILKNRQERAIYLLSHPTKRREFTDGLAHFKWLDMRFAHSIPASTAHTAKELATLLRQHGAKQMVWIISEDSSIDASELPLEEAMNHVWGLQRGAILSCIPGKLAFFRGEEMKSECLLTRP